MSFLPIFSLEQTGYQPSFRKTGSGFSPIFQNGGGGDYPLESETVTPTKETIEVTPSSGFYGLSNVTVNPIPDAYQDVSVVTATAEDVLDGKIIVENDGDVTEGTMANNGELNGAIDGLTITNYPLPSGYISGGNVSFTNGIELILGTI